MAERDFRRRRQRENGSRRRCRKVHGFVVDVFLVEKRLDYVVSGLFRTVLFVRVVDQQQNQSVKIKTQLSLIGYRVVDEKSELDTPNIYGFAIETDAECYRIFYDINREYNLILK